MANEESFEIIPKKEVERLKSDVEKIKKDPIGSSNHGKELIESMGYLGKSMNNMFELFKVANKEIKEEASTLEFIKKITPLFDGLNNKMDKLSDQHDKIAEGIVAVAEIAKELREDMELLRKEHKKQTQNFSNIPQNQKQQTNTQQIGTVMPKPVNAQTGIRPIGRAPPPIGR